MTTRRPDWADDLRLAFESLGKREQLRPLNVLLEAMSGAEIADPELVDFLQDVDQNDPALLAIRICLSRWDKREHFPDSLGQGTPPRTNARRNAIYDSLQLSADLREILSDRAGVLEDKHTVISKTFEPWYAEESKKRSSVYWDDYVNYLTTVKRWPAPAITSLDEATTEVVERLSRPTRREAKQTKGLVVGYVQSGKTANFTGVAAKAIDAGYRLIIVLTGTIEILRAQTQRRMDMELMGVENILADQDPTDPEVAKELDYQQDRDWLDGRFIKHGDALTQPGVVQISRVTSHQSDYKRLPMAMTKLKFARKNKQKPLNDEENLFHSDAYVAIIKKNSAPLKKLIQDLKPLKNDLAELPVLIIDDESDQASVDTTNPSKWNTASTDDRKRTAINGYITEILKLCPRAQYVGYTATPFANVFVDPNDERDIFPSDFVLSLDPPPDYMGVKEFHDIGKRWDDEEKTYANSNERAYIRPLEGDAKSDPDLRDTELQEALDAWVLSGAIKKYREANSARTFRHHTMLVHESVKKNDHKETAEHVRFLWHRSKFNTGAGIARLKKLFEDDYLPVMTARAEGEAVPRSFDVLKPFLGTALAEMTIDGDPVLILNSDKEIQDQQKKLDFEADQVWRILVGGTQLSRGFTVEGLTISYFRRKAGQADTLMQAGRWFGYRPGFRDLVRLYIRRDSEVDLYEAFEALLLDEAGFRSELQQYEGFDSDGMPVLEPRQIPPLVSQHLSWLRPAARNKMWNAVIADKAPTDVQDLYGLPERDSDENRANFEDVVVPLLMKANEEVLLPFVVDGKAGKQRARVGLIDAQEFAALLDRYQWHNEFQDNIRAIRQFLAKIAKEDKLRDWAIVWPQTAGRTVDIPELGNEDPIVKRKRRAAPRIDFIGSDRKHRAAARPAAHGEHLASLGASPTRGAILVSIAPDRDPDDPADPVKRGQLVGLLSIAAPASAVPKRNLVRWTVRNPQSPEDVTFDPGEAK
ncbi:UNVERIFIED_ORG: Z1 domain-containing protein [Gordonia westfalica J30]